LNLLLQNKNSFWTLPDTAKEKPQQGKVVAVGKARDDMTVSGRYRSYGRSTVVQELKVEGNDYLMMREEDILAIV
jgi:chaperonin GroES